VIAHAKVNLRLVVLAREESGFHQLETVFCALSLGDVVEVESAAAGVELEVTGADLGPAESNLAFRAAQAFFRESGIDAGARIGLEKRVPAGAGLGGGSSDAATVLRLLNRIHGEPLEPGRLLEIGGRLGADVPFFLLDTPLALGWGRGDRLLPLPAPSPAPALVVVPPFGISTPDAYAQLAAGRAGGGPGRALASSPDSAAANPAAAALRLDGPADWDDLASWACNDFEAVLFPRYEMLAAVRATIADAGARIARMSGSGSALFGIWPEGAERDRAAARVRTEHPSCLVLATVAGTVESAPERR
jgi:4-diphosphocytidyl-2-C-methyl-D-erythritol kinase